MSRQEIEKLEEAMLRIMSAIHEVRFELDGDLHEQERARLWRRKKRLQSRQLRNMELWEEAMACPHSSHSEG